jgi:DNA-directed RNA polymerase beta subunit
VLELGRGGLAHRRLGILGEAVKEVVDLVGREVTCDDRDALTDHRIGIVHELGYERCPPR